MGEVLVRLSKLQKSILFAIANHTVNSYESDGAHRRGEDYISYRELFYACVDEYWGEGANLKAAKVSFSRALRVLVYDKGLVVALALKWVLIAKEKGRLFEDDTSWQGGGRRHVSGQFSVGGKTYDHLDDQPRFRMLGLTEEGWRIAHSLAEQTE